MQADSPIFQGPLVRPLSLIDLVPGRVKNVEIFLCIFLKY